VVATALAAAASTIIVDPQLAGAQKIISPPPPESPAVSSPAPLQQPSPTDLEGRKPEQPQTQYENQGASRDQRGTTNSPMIVKIQPTPKTEAEAEQDAKDRAEKAANDQAIRQTNRNLVVIGCLQLAVFVGQLVVFGYQAAKLRRSIVAAERAARASVLQANALVHSELAVVRVREIRIKPHNQPDISSGPPPEDTEISVKFFNYGRTPAFPLRISLGTAVVDALTGEPKYTWIREYGPGEVLAEDREFLVEGYRIKITDYSMTRELLDTHKVSLWFFGKFEFEDLLGNEDTWKFCFGWLPYFPPSRQIPGSPKRGGFIEGGPESYRQKRGNKPPI
jgi:hypothetical protein